MLSARLVAGSVIATSLVLGCSSRPASTHDKPAAPDGAANAAPTSRPSSDERIDPLMQPTLVTLHLKKTPAGEAYRSLFDQMGANLATWPSGMFDDVHDPRDPQFIPPVTIDMDKAPFWEAFRELEEQTGIGAEYSGNEMRLSKFPRTSRSGGITRVSGPLMLVADQPFGGRMIDCLQVFVEPRIRVLSHDRFLKITTAVDANGEPVIDAVAAEHARAEVEQLQALPEKQRAMLLAQRAEQKAQAEAVMAMMGNRWFDRSSGNVFTVNLPMPVPRTGRFSGTVSVLAEVDQRSIEISGLQLAKPAELNANGERYLISALNPEPGEYYILLTSFNNAVIPKAELSPELLDADGRAFTRRGQSSFADNGRWDVTWHFHQDPERDAPPVKLTFVREGRKVELPITVAKDVERDVDGNRFFIHVLNRGEQDWLVNLIAVGVTPTIRNNDFAPVAFDAAGKALILVGRTGGGAGRHDLQLLLRQGPDCGAPVKLVIGASKGTRELEIPFSFGRDRKSAM